MPKRYLPSGPVMDDTHAKLRAMAVSLGTG
jgi:hypothetical protein